MPIQLQSADSACIVCDVAFGCGVQHDLLSGGFHVIVLVLRNTMPSGDQKPVSGVTGKSAVQPQSPLFL